MFTLHNGDCLEYMKTLQPESVQAVITDPPYGINWAGSNASTLTWKPIENDNGSLDLRPILNMPCLVISFGANCYPEQLPHRGRWICWDKRIVEKSDRMLGSPFELAWMNKTSGFDKMYRVMHGGVVNADGHNAVRVHPTQKPIVLMKRIILDYTNEGDTVFDPFMGSGTTGIACIQTGRHFIGCEISPEYFAIAESRIKSAALQPALFTPSNNRLHLTGGGQSATQSSFTAEVIPPAKLPAKSPRR